MGRYAIIRTDRIGDLILALPVAEAIKETKPGAEVAYVVSPRTSEIARACPFIDDVIEYDEESKGPSQFLTLIRAVKRLRPDTAVFLRPTMKVALAFLVAGVPCRVGTTYRYYSAMFNRKVKEHRKYAEKHEVEYNLGCLGPVTDIRTRHYEPKILVDSAAENFAVEILRQRDLRQKDFAIIHPGSGGSARNLPLRSYARLADLIEGRFTTRVLVTTGEGESRLADEMDTYRSRNSLTVKDIGSLLNLAALIKQSRLFLSGSTGPMHIAAATGTPTISFFSPVRSCSPRRWRPLGGKNAIVMPPVPECPTCVGSKCEYYDCMELIDMGQVSECIDRLLTR